MGSSQSKLAKYAFFLGSAAALAGHADAQTSTVADFTFESSLASGSTTSTNGMSAMLSAEVGLGTAVAVHAATATVYSSPAGNGSARSFSANNYVAGDYFQFTIDSTMYMNLALSFDAISSSTGPKVFTLEYATAANSTAFTTFGLYTVNANGSTFAATSATAPATGPSFKFDLSAIAALNGTTDIFRLVDSDTTTATGGTSRLDNFLVTGAGLGGGGGVPEPSTMALLSVAGAGAMLMAARRRKRA